MRPKNKLALATLIAMTFSSIGCGKKTIKDHSIFVTRKGADKVGSTKNPSSTNSGQTQFSLKDLEAAIGLRSYEQVRETMATLTRVDPTGQNISDIYDEVKTQLPNNNDIKTFLASHQVGITKMGVEFCDSLINQANLRSTMFPNFNFASTPRTAFSAGGSANLAGSMIDQFWGTGLSNLPDRNTAIDSLERLTDDLLSGENLNDASVTLQVSKGICTAVLASSPVAIF